MVNSSVSVFISTSSGTFISFRSSPYSLFCLDRVHTSTISMKSYLNAHNIFYFATMYFSFYVVPQ